MCTNKCLCKTCVFVDVDDVVLFCNNNNNNECLLPELHNFHLYTETNVVLRAQKQLLTVIVAVVQILSSCLLIS